jgi:hypothetical protein
MRFTHALHCLARGERVRRAASKGTEIFSVGLKEKLRSVDLATKEEAEWTHSAEDITATDWETVPK